MGLAPPIDHHVLLARRLSAQDELCATVFSLNYDPLVERAAEAARVRLVDGFSGFEHAYFDAQLFEERHLIIKQGVLRSDVRRAGTPVHLLKLHGSLGWYDAADYGPRRCGFDMHPPYGGRRLMVPPQHRKATDTTAPPYAALWSRFRGALTQDSHRLNRLVCMGYGMRDEHVNSVIENALVRRDFTLLVFAMGLDATVFDRWAR